MITPETDDLAVLLRLAGKRPDVACERSERVRSVARAQWKRELRLRARRRLLVAGGLAVAAGLVIAVTTRQAVAPSSPSSTVQASVESVVGVASSRNDSGATTSSLLAVGSEIRANAIIGTTSRGRLALRLATGQSLRLDVETEIRLREPATIELHRGAVYVDSAAPSSLPLTVATTHGMIHEQGTQFEVRLERGDLVVRLREGAVTLATDHEGHSYQVAAGSELRRAVGGAISRRALTSWAEEWRWVMVVAPMIELDGRSAMDFLEWIVRERGLKLAFDSPETARVVPSIRLAGSLAKLTPEEALDAVLPSCRLSYRIEAGALTVASEP